MTDPYATFSASLPLRVLPSGWVDLCDDVRPWNGRRLEEEEKVECWLAANAEYLRTDSHGMAAQAAHEWLSEHAP